MAEIKKQMSDHKAAVTTGLKWTSLSSIYIAIMQVAQLVVLTHYVSPTDFGIVAILMIVVGFIQTFLDMGLSNAIIQRQEISREQFASLYWLNVMTAMILAVFLFVWAPIISSAYGSSSTAGLLRVLVLVFIFGSISGLYKVLFQRDLSFGIISGIESLSTTVSFISAIVLAVNGFGVRSIVYPLVINSVLSSVAFSYFGSRQYGRPILFFEIEKLAGFIRFGMFQLGERLLIYLSTQLDVLVIGRVLGAEATGLYHVAKNLVFRVFWLVGPVVTRVTTPMMARVQSNDDLLRHYYLKSVYFLSFIIAPIYGLMGLLADEIVDVFLGSRWAAAAPILQILTVYGFIRSVGNPIGALLLAKNRPQLGFYWNLAMLFLLPIIILLGKQWGVLGICWSLLIFSAVLKVPEYLLLVKPLSDISFKEYTYAYSQPFAIATICYLVVWPLTRIYDGAVLMLLVSVVYCILYAATSIWRDYSLKNIIIDFFQSKV